MNVALCLETQSLYKQIDALNDALKRAMPEAAALAE